MMRFLGLGMAAISIAAVSVVGLGERAEAGSSVAVSGTCSGWTITDQASDTVWENAEFFTVDDYQKGAAPGRGQSVVIDDHAYFAPHPQSRTFFVQWVMTDGSVFTSQQITASRDLSDCPKQPAPKFEAGIVCSATSGVAVFSLIFGGEWQKFSSFELNGMRVGNGSVIPNVGGTVYGYYPTGYGPNDVSVTKYLVQPAEDCTPAPAVTDPAPTEPPVSSEPPVVIVTDPSTTVPAAIDYHSSAEVSFVRHCDGSWTGTLYLARNGDSREFGFWHTDGTLGAYPQDRSVVEITGHQWPVVVDITNADLAKVPVKVNAVTEEQCASAVPTTSDSTTTTAAPAAVVVSGQMLPATGNEAIVIGSWATLVLGVGEILRRLGRRPRVA